VSSDVAAVARAAVPLQRRLLPGALALAVALGAVFALVIVGQNRIATLSEDTRSQLLPAMVARNDNARDVERLILFGEEVVNGRDPAARRQARLAAQMLVYDQSFHLDEQTRLLAMAALKTLAAIAEQSDRHDRLTLELRRTLLAAQGALPADGQRRRAWQPLLNAIADAASEEALDQAVLALDRQAGRLRERTPVWQGLIDLRRRMLELERSSADRWEAEAQRLKAATDTLAAESELAARERMAEVQAEARQVRNEAALGLAALVALLVAAFAALRHWILLPLSEATRFLASAPTEAAVAAQSPPASAVAEIHAIFEAARALAANTRALDEERRKVVQVRLEAAAAREQDLRELVAQRTAELEQAKQRAEAANEAKSSFLANMSHELRTPLNAILGFSRLMQRSALSPQDRDSVGIINRSGEHLLQLINDVLDMSKLEARRATIQPVAFDLRALLGDIAAMLGDRAAAARLYLTVDAPDDLPRYVRADHVKLRQILINLVGNAIKFTHEGGIVLRVEQSDPGAPGTRLAFIVEDSGVGIAETDLERIFVPFEQVAEHGANKGSGLGLAIACQFAELMGGSLTVKSEPGVGSAFRLDLPVEIVAASEVQQAVPVRKVVGIAPGQPAYRLLVVEDNAESRQLLVRELATLGLDVREATNGAEAVVAFEAWRPHLIWMDWRMPVMNGMEATRRIRALPGGDATRIVGLSASAFEECGDEFRQAGCDDYLRKPYRIAEVLDAMTRHLGLQYRTADGDPQPLPPACADTAAALGELTAAQRAQLLDAVAVCHFGDAMRVVEELRAKHPQAAAGVDAALARFDWQGLRLMLEQAGQG
jgi:signal transduction histidine kinase/DNA-binding response OmpR family regulator